MYIVLAVVVLIILSIGGILLVNAGNNSTNPDQGSNGTADKMMDGESMEKNDDRMEGDDKMDGDDKMKDDSAQSGSYVDYDERLLANASNGDVVLFFLASWCPTCKILNDSINGSLDEIPSDLTILKTDYDTYTQLKQKYGVTYQHTLVQVDAQGNLIKKWSGGFSLDDIVAQLT
ncbi:MAG: Thioredoxin [candidate division WS6 bacterium OLB20]|uniref:Thioredoxin n=1 Tax=candidate division WS6 bacterium OLB20 TaxID=1617426 RepID=A0A136LWN2_9BACT|nr:MAG: Thioredoxin [candidate division WS6 bacterium OLB20]